MADTKLTDNYKECKVYADNIMDDIKSLLTKKKIKFENNGKYQIEIKSKKSVDDIKKLVKTLDIPKDVLKMLVSIVDVSGTVVIGQRMKNQ